MSVVDPGRQPTYNVGGQAPYGWIGSPAYDPADVPKIEDRPDLISLYERLDWGDVSDFPDTPNKLSYRNPPFMGVGSTSTALNPMEDVRSTGMTAPGPPHRILRGYIRPTRLVAWSTTAPMTDADKASHARLYFMYNPASLNRDYMKYESSLNLTAPASDPTQTSPFSQVTAQFSLIFDRQEEVAILPDHPGVLIDLAVFDLLIHPQNDNPTPDNTTVGTAAMRAPKEIGDVSLVVDTGKSLVVVFSPYITFTGTIMEASAQFQKFSHRMTPTRMEIVITMKILSAGQEPSIDYANTAAVVGAQNAQAALTASAPAVRANQQAADAANDAGRANALSWASQWLPGHATKNGVPYDSGPARCDNVAQDSLTDQQPPHVPNAMDCSSFVSRSLNMAGWCQALFITPCSLSNDYYAVAVQHPEVWLSYNFGGKTSHVDATLGNNPTVRPVDLSKFVVLARPGAILVKSGTGSNGHVAFINSDLGTPSDKSYNHRYELLESTGPKGIPPSTPQMDLKTIMQNYDWILVPEPNTYAGKPQVTG
jgi:hypothetical protein